MGIQLQAGGHLEGTLGPLDHPLQQVTVDIDPSLSSLPTVQQPSGYLDLQHGNNVKSVMEGRRGGKEGTSSGLGF